MPNAPLLRIGFEVVGGPHRGELENPTCYARTTQRGKFVRWTKPRISTATGKVLPARLTHWARYQDYIEHVRKALSPEQCFILHEKMWPRAGTEKFVIDVIVQFRGRRHSDADHVASTIADALFPKPPSHKPRGTSHWSPIWRFELLRQSPGDGLVLARTMDYRDESDIAVVWVNVHGPYPRREWSNWKNIKPIIKPIIERHWRAR